MDLLRRPAELERNDLEDPVVSRRALFKRARLGLLALAGVAVFGVATSTDDVLAKQSGGGSKGKGKSAKGNKGSKNTTGTKKNKTGQTAKTKPADPNAPSPYSKYVVQGQDKYNCTDFAHQADAQAVLRLAPNDPNNLDRNRNGIACDGVEAAQDGVPGGFMMPPYDINPVPRP